MMVIRSRWFFYISASNNKTEHDDVGGEPLYVCFIVYLYHPGESFPSVQIVHISRRWLSRTTQEVQSRTLSCQNIIVSLILEVGRWIVESIQRDIRLR